MNKSQMREFFYRLDVEGVKFKEDKKGMPYWTCFHDFRFAKKILNSMKITKGEQHLFLKLCEAHGGFCDCEILFNAEERIMEE